MTPKTLTQTLLLITLLTLSLTTPAKSINTQAQTFPIIEPDLLQVIKQHLEQLSKTHYLKNLKTALQNQAIKQFANPKPVAGLTTTKRFKQWTYDPSIIMPQNIYNSQGKLIIKAGSRYNPLKYVHLDETLLFYDARDPKQVHWAKMMDKKLKGKDKLILVGGSILLQHKLFKKVVYFDQQGKLIKKFHIHTVPADVSQKKLKLVINTIIVF